MGLVDRLGAMVGGGAARRAPAGRTLDVPSGYNVRELGGYATPAGRTLTHRFLRSGGTDHLSSRDINYLLEYGVTDVLDLRGDFESPRSTCRFAGLQDVRWVNVALFDYDISDARLRAHVGEGRRTYLVDSYLTMLANRDAVRRILGFFDEARPGGCALFHCAAGMDRTGMTAMLLLGLVGASRRDVIADYAYSFGPTGEVDAVVDGLGQGRDMRGARPELLARIEAIESVYDALVEGYGGVRDYLIECDLDAALLDRVAARLIPAQSEGAE